MAPQYKLTYFDIRALAEPIRLIFALKGIEFEDVRVPRDDWPTLKPTTPWGNMPVLHEGDKVLAQSSAIQRYLAKKYNLAGTNDFETAKADEIVEAMTDLRQAVFKAVMEKDETKKPDLMKTLTEETFPKYLSKFEEILQKNGGYFTGSLTYADLNVASYLQVFNENFENKLLEKFPNVQKHQVTVFNLKGIKEWVEKRPKTQF